MEGGQTSCPYVGSCGIGRSKYSLKEKYLLLGQIEQGFKLYRGEFRMQQRFLGQLSLDEAMATEIIKPSESWRTCLKGVGLSLRLEVVAPR